MTPLDLDDIESRIKDGIDDLDGPFYSGIADDAFSALAVLLAEVERLRAERAAERAAVVAWIRHLATDAREWSGVAYVYDGLADAIENGEHRREETK